MYTAQQQSSVSQSQSWKIQQKKTRSLAEKLKGEIISHQPKFNLISRSSKWGPKYWNLRNFNNNCESFKKRSHLKGAPKAFTISKYGKESLTRKLHTLKVFSSKCGQK